MSLTLAERSASYARAFPKWPAPRTDARWLDGVWLVGNNFRNSSKLYGAYPPGYLRRIASLFPDSRRVLHVFSGSLTPAGLAKEWPGAEHWRVDAVAEREPDTIGNAEDLAEVVRANELGAFDLVLADPPYSASDAERYGFKMPNRRRVLREIAKVVAPGGNLVWLDTVRPQYRKDEWHAWGLICLVRSTMHRVRLVSMFRRVGP